MWVEVRFIYLFLLCAILSCFSSICWKDIPFSVRLLLNLWLKISLALYGESLSGFSFCSINWCSIILKSDSTSPPNVFFFFTIVLAILDSLYSYFNFTISFSISIKKPCWYFDLDCVQYIDRETWHLNNTGSSHPWA